MRDIKSSSSRYSETLGKRLFSWQVGYGGFTVNPSQVARVKQCIERQEEHHRKISFKEEYLELLKRSGGADTRRVSLQALRRAIS